MSNKPIPKDRPPKVLLTVEMLYLETIKAVQGFNNTLKVFVMEGLAGALRDVQSSLNWAQRSRLDPLYRIKALNEAIIGLDLFKSYIRIALEYGKSNKGGGLTFTAAAIITELVSEVHQQLNAWKQGTLEYQQKTNGSADDALSNGSCN